MGDLDTKKFAKALKQYFNELWSSIRFMQVPHHGSEYNYNAALYEYCQLCFIQAGKYSRYGHPNNKTVSGILSQGALPLLVTEEPATTLTFPINVEP
jgi:beta-lactamase superfamily II metal-dependent hydrolase